MLSTTMFLFFKPAIRGVSLSIAIWVSTANFAQTLSMVRQGESTLLVQASAPAGNPHTVQTSENLNVWLDVRANITEQVSIAITNSGVSKRYFRLTPSEPPPSPIIVMLIGDSMGSDCCGWGQGMYGYFKSEATFINYAIPNYSTRFFLQSAEKENMLLIKPNYVLINYGYMDNANDAERSTTLEQFEQNLRIIVEMVRGWGGVPIFIPVHAPRVWDQNNKIVGAAGMVHRNAITERVAEDLEVPYIDLFQASMDLFNDLGPVRTASLAFELFPGDPMHISRLGGEHLSQMIVYSLPQSLGPYLDGTHVPPPIP